jgi:ABC-type dipeptide/oligopeptide/nickel transport system ATPase component
MFWIREAKAVTPAYGRRGFDNLRSQMLSIQNLSVEYIRRRQKVLAVQNVSLSIGPGEAVGLVGESGSGKSTVALAVLRLIGAHEGRISAGRLMLDNVDLLTLSEEAMRDIRGRRIAMIFQDPFTSLNPVMRIREQMEEVLQAHRASNSEDQKSRIDDRSSILDALQKVQLDAERTLNSYPHQLSGGQRQRVMIATALLGNPELILADEPTTALDVLVQKEILDLLFKLQKDLRLSLLFISHNMGVIAQYTQKIAVMKAGSIVEMGTPDALFLRPQNDYTKQLIAAIPRI